MRSSKYIATANRTAAWLAVWPSINGLPDFLVVANHFALQSPKSLLEITCLNEFGDDRSCRASRYRRGSFRRMWHVLPDFPARSAPLRSRGCNRRAPGALGPWQENPVQMPAI